MGGARETKQVYEVTYNAMRSAFALVCDMPACNDPTCKSCSALQLTIAQPDMKSHLASDIAKNKGLPVIRVTADSGKGLGSFAKDVVGVERFKCFNHITGTIVRIQPRACVI